MGNVNPRNAGTVAGAAASPCCLTVVVVPGQPVAYKATAGTVKLKIIPGTGTIQFDAANCAVTEGGANSVSFNSPPTATEVSFDVKSGKTYVFSAAYIFTDGATATLVEDCTAQTRIDSLRAVLIQAGRDYPITVS